MRPQLEHLYSLLTCGPRTFTGSFSVALSAPPHLGVRKCELEHFTFPSGALLRSMASTALVGVGGGLSLRLAAASSCSSTAASFYRRAGGGSRRHGRRLVLLHRGGAWVSVFLPPSPFSRPVIHQLYLDLGGTRVLSGLGNCSCVLCKVKEASPTRLHI